MGSIALIDGLSPGQVRQFSYQACYFKRLWADSWTWVPYVRCNRASEQAAPDVGNASFEWNFGEIKQHFDSSYLFYNPVLAANAYTMVRSYNQWGNWATWIGVVQRETAHVHGTSWPQGDQGFEAFSIEHLLDRNQINGAYTESGFVERQVVFNRKAGHGLAQQGNRSTNADSNGVYYFSRDGEKWTNLQIIEYLLQNFVQDGIRFEVAGAWGPLNQIIEEHNFYGQSVLAAINTLIDRRYGLNWRLLVPDTAGGTVYIYIYSQLAYPLQIGDVQVPANPIQAVVPIINDHSIDPVMTFDALHQFDSVEVRGANLLICGTFAHADGTLVKGWTDAQEAAYEDPGHGDPDENDRARRAEKFDNVFQKLIVPRDWDGYLGDGEGGATVSNAQPMVYYDASIDVNEQAPFWLGEKRFEAEIPFEVETLDDDAPVEYRRAMAIIKHPTEDAYSLIEKAWPEDDDARYPGNLSLAKREMGIIIRPEINHVYGLNHFDNDDTNVTAAFDYEDVIVTAAFRSDAQLRAAGVVPGQRMTETGRTKVVHAPEAEFWLVLPDTVTDIEDGQLVREFSDYEVVRDDSDIVLQLLALNLIWFCFARGTMTMQVKTITPAWPTSTFIIGAQGTWHATLLGTPVTKKEYVWGKDISYTEVITGSEEIVFKANAMKAKKMGIGGKATVK